ncbi:alpha/beta fold hydrolase [Nocardia sp. R6R-6]|uniref:alpha/beta fold hydrolase n=1 Tax=Nocardia sp. R6R-6 TaxID=3459303 RepID=UPI00403D6B65
MAFTPMPKDRCRLIESGGVQVNVVDMGDPGSIPVLFLHGGGPGCSGWSDWHPVGEQLGEGYRRIYLDFPHYGASPAGRLKGPTYTALGAVIVDVLEALGVEQAHFVCQSIGGAAAIRLAADRPDLFSSMAVTGVVIEYGVVTPNISDKVAVAAIMPFLGEPSPETMRELLAFAEWAEAESIPDDLVHARFEASMNHLERFSDPEVLGTSEDLGPYLDRNKVPTLVAYGDRDPWAPVEVPLHLFTRFENSRLVIVKGGSHHFPEERPDVYLSLIRAWLTEHEERQVDSIADEG